MPEEVEQGGDDEPPPKPAPSPDAWTVRRLLAWIGQALTSQKVESPRLMAELLLADVLGCERLKLYLDPDREPEPGQLTRLRSLVGRALKHEPIQYLTGEAWFFGMPFMVDSRVLIPRPSTETIVEAVMQRVRRGGEGGAAGGGRGDAGGDQGANLGQAAGSPAQSDADDAVQTAKALTAAARSKASAKKRLGEGVFIADICTGSGCIAIALAKNLGGARVVAADISVDALACAQANALRHGVHDRVRFREGNLVRPVEEAVAEMSDGWAGFDFVVTNPPYVPDHEWGAVAANVKDFEPHGALRGGAEGLDFVAPLIEDAPRLLRPGGWLMVEVAACTAAQAAQLARNAGLQDVRILKDGDGLERVIEGRRA